MPPPPPPLPLSLSQVYAWMDTQRGYLQLAAKEITRGDFEFTRVMNALFCMSLALIPIILVMTPNVNVWGHLLIFVQNIFIKHLVVTANFYEAWHRTAPAARRWFYFYSFITCIYPAMLLADFIYAEVMFRKYGMTEDEFLLHGCLIPWYVTMFFDLSWFACLATTSRFLPPAPHLKIKYELVTEEELAAMHEKAEKTWKKARILGAMKGAGMMKMRKEAEKQIDKGDIEAPEQSLIRAGAAAAAAGAMVSKAEGDSRL